MFSLQNLLQKESPGRLAVGLVALLALLHLLVIGRFALSVDEAHYALYGLMPDWSYFDHPPMVGWLQAVIVPLASGEFFLRLWPLLLSIVASFLLYRLTRELFPEAPAWYGLVSVTLLQSAIIFQLISMALVPDGPLLVFGLAGSLFLYRAINHNRWRDWLLLGLMFGLAGLSKYTAITLVVTALVYIALERRWTLLAGPRPWVAMLLAVLVITPVLYWNATHDWLSFKYQLGHGAPDRSWDWLRFARAQLAQVFAYAPGIFIFGIAALWTGLRSRAEPGVRFSIALALPILLLFGWGSGFEMTLPHWTVLAWAGLAPLTAWWLAPRWSRRWVRVTAYFTGGYSVVLILLLHSQLFSPWLPFEEHRHPLGDLYGWEEATEHALELSYSMSQALDEVPPLMVGNWSLASRVAWYARPTPVLVADNRFDQFDLWYGAPKPGSEGLLIVPDNYHGRPKVSGEAHFRLCTQLDTLVVRQGPTPVHTFYYYRCQGYHD